MKIIIALLFVPLAPGRPEDTYTTQDDNIDIDEILKNDRLYNKYFDCLMGKGKCTSDGKELKDNLPDAIKTDCQICRNKHKHGSEKVLKFMLTNKKKDYEDCKLTYVKIPT